LNQLVASPLVARHALALREAAALIGGPQVRNTATLGGNVAHGLPAADGTIALLALDAQAEIANRQGCRRLALKELFLGPGRTVLDSEGDVLVGFYLPLLLPGQASAFRRVMRPQGVAIAILNVAVWVARTGTTIKDVRIAIGPGGSTPTRAYHAEEALRGKTLSSSVMSQAMDALLTEARFRTSPHRATTDYRRHLAGVLLKETFQVAWDRAARGDPD
jgi:carbon-monoxide dehydrogenase medium subunit